KHGKTYVTYHGGTKNRAIWQTFQAKKNPQVFIAQIGTGGVGIELFAADTAIFYSKTFSWDEYDQSRKRLDRYGQRKKVTFIHLMAENTIDEYLSAVLKKKGNVSRRVLDHYRQLIKAKEGLFH